MQQHELQTKANNAHLLQLQIFGLSARRTRFFLVHGAQSSPGQLWNKAERQSSKHPPFTESTHARFRGRARTQAPTTRNYTLKLPTIGVIARVNPIQVQWKGLALRGLPPWLQYLPHQVSFLCLRRMAGPPVGWVQCPPDNSLIRNNGSPETGVHQHVKLTEGSNLAPTRLQANKRTN